MNNKHQELIEEKVNKYTEAKALFRLGEGELERWARLQNLLVEILQDTIDTVLKEERKRVLEALTTTKDTTQMLQGWERYWIEVKPNRFVENCIECENTVRILKALDTTPPYKV